MAAGIRSKTFWKERFPWPLYSWWTIGSIFRNMPASGVYNTPRPTSWNGRVPIVWKNNSLPRTKSIPALQLESFTLVCTRGTPIWFFASIRLETNAAMLYRFLSHFICKLRTNISSSATTRGAWICPPTFQRLDGVYINLHSPIHRQMMIRVDLLNLYVVDRGCANDYTYGRLYTASNTVRIEVESKSNR